MAGIMLERVVGGERQPNANTAPVLRGKRLIDQWGREM